MLHRATPLGTSQYLDACHRTVSCTSANTGVCTGTYQPDQLTDRKTVLGGGLQYGGGRNHLGSTPLYSVTPEQQEREQTLVLRAPRRRI